MHLLSNRPTHWWHNTNVPVETLGETEVRVRAFGRVKHLLVSVVKEQDKPLFGLDWYIIFNLRMPKGDTICNVKPKLKKEASSVEHKECTELNLIQLNGLPLWYVFQRVVV